MSLDFEHGGRLLRGVLAFDTARGRTQRTPVNALPAGSEAAAVETRACTCDKHVVLPVCGAWGCEAEL